ncbi:MAG: M14 family metallopeptidase [Bacillota bacterium]|nr:M14 family metallopeptidase [Bacillota bacterium]
MRKGTAFLLLFFIVCLAVTLAHFRGWGPVLPEHPEKAQRQETQTEAEPGQQETSPQQVCSEEIYGYSGLNTPLKVYKISNPAPTKKILCVFAMHGFEDTFYRDGQALVDTANGVIASLKEDTAALGAYEVMIVPCANPDGLARGWTCNGPGRCQISLGIDINMDFAYNFRVRTNTRNKTGEQPFTSPEAAALRDLVLKERPDIIVDFHGWVNSASGDPGIAEIFCKHLGLTYEDKEKTFYDGFFAGWAAQYAKSVLVEYPNPFTGQGPYEGKSDQKYDYAHSEFNKFGYAEKTAEALKEIVQQSRKAD